MSDPTDEMLSEGLMMLVDPHATANDVYWKRILKQTWEAMIDVVLAEMALTK